MTDCGPIDAVQHLFEGFHGCWCLMLDWRENGPVGLLSTVLWTGLEPLRLRSSNQLIRSHSVIINCSIIFFSSVFAYNYLLLTKCQQPIKYEKEKQIGSGRIFQSSLFSPTVLIWLHFSSLFWHFLWKCQDSSHIHISCCSSPRIAADIKVSSRLKPPPPKCSIFISVIVLLGGHLELLPTDFHAFEGGWHGALTGLMVLAEGLPAGLIDQTVICSCRRLR